MLLLSFLRRCSVVVLSKAELCRCPFVDGDSVVVSSLCAVAPNASFVLCLFLFSFVFGTV